MLPTVVSAEPEHEQKRVFDSAHLIESQMAYLLSEAARIYGADHLTQDACPGLTDGHLGVKARRRCGLRCRAHDDR